MNIRDLKYLCALARYKNFGKAANACFVSQPALSMQIKKLEDYLGVLLIERTNKRVLFTEIGKIIVERAQDILCRVDALNEFAKQSRDPFSGELHLGIIPTLAPYLLPITIPELSVQFPKLVLYLVEEMTSNLLTKLQEGTLDAAILALPIGDPFCSQALFDENFVLAIPKENILAKQKTVTFSDLEGKTLLLLEEGHCLRDQALEVCHKTNASDYKSFYATSLETLRHMVAAGVGITLMPKLACQINDGICYLPFSSPIPKRTIGLIWRESTSKKRLLEHLVIHIQTIMSLQSGIVVE